MHLLQRGAYIGGRLNSFAKGRAGVTDFNKDCLEMSRLHPRGGIVNVSKLLHLFGLVTIELSLLERLLFVTTL